MKRFFLFAKISAVGVAVLMDKKKLSIVPILSFMKRHETALSSSNASSVLKYTFHALLRKKIVL